MKILLTLILALPVLSWAKPAVIITDMAVVEKSGCWATLYDDRDFTGNKITLFNGMDLPEMSFSDGSIWKGRIESIAVGPKAKVLLYGKENFKDKEEVVRPGRKLAGFIHLPWKYVESLKLSCVP